jgi:hypothetical protein
MITFWGRSSCDQWGMDAKQDHDALYIVMGRWNQVTDPKNKMEAMKNSRGNGSNKAITGPTSHNGAGKELL